MKLTRRTSRVVAVAIATVMFGTLAACGSSEEDSGTSVDTEALPDIPQDVLDAAEEEGTVSVWMTSSVANYEEFYKDAFEEAYPDITVDLFRSDSSNRDSRYLNEFQAGVADVDVMAGGSSGANARLKPADALKPSPPYLIDDILDGSNWTGGEVPWADRDGEYFLQSDRNAVPLIAVNTDAPEITTWDDLLSPELDGKITMTDPRESGRGFAGAQLMYFAEQLGPDYTEKFFANDRIVFNDDTRQMATWVDQGEMLVNLAPNYQEYADLAELGSENTELIQTLEVDGESLGGILSADGIAFLPNQETLPHDNAARVYLNWFYSQAGQQAMVDILGYTSARSDVDNSELPEYLVPRDDATYVNINIYTEEADVVESREFLGGIL